MPEADFELRRRDLALVRTRTPAALLHTLERSKAWCFLAITNGGCQSCVPNAVIGG